MALILTNEEIENLLDIQDYLSALEAMYFDYAQGEAKEPERVEVIVPQAPDKTYGFKSMTGVYPAKDVAALRINSDMISWQERRVKLPLAPGERWVGLIFLFSLSQLKLLAIMQDGFMQRMRVGTTTALGAKYLARSNASVYGIIGTGWQAGAQIQAMAKVRPLRKIKVFSPNVEHRREFAREWRDKLGIDVLAVDTVREAVIGSDIVGCATNSLEPVIKGEWLSAGMHVTCIRPVELDRSVLERADVCFIHNLFKGSQIRPSQEIVKKELLSEHINESLKGKRNDDINKWGLMPQLADMIGGMVPGRRDDQQITCFVNNAGIALQFAAVGALAYKKACEKGIGNELPDHWFTQNVHP
ncbi:MAG: ornithine cyclodeaminase family protein [Dehalobacterium sp.]